MSRLGQRFELLTGGPCDQPTRQQTLRDNLRAALEWLTSAGDNDGAACALSDLWVMAGQGAEGAKGLQWVIELDGELDASLRAPAMVGAARLAWRPRTRSGVVRTRARDLP